MSKTDIRAGQNVTLGLAPNSQLTVSNSPNPNQHAIALSYASGDYAPKVVAKGRGLIAEQIIARAKQHGVFVHESKDLVALLMQVDIDDHIPPALYQAIAEILAWLYRLEENKADEEDVII
ncbi:MAG: flagellar protein FhlB [Methylotenera sp.]|nr:EscU/YscU/HrcU family type III secretion system export apparatus switch protein [Methylotenera sp.]MDD4925860.1 EscU/YscU/HrcU family type III secretion system export apparatus switch protein [Methylotenera sp.]NOS96332.1 flagellar protein FhlB [Methylotenera sp.]NOU40587.1 flagellar protein FhlB [Methylotenera sp.]